MADDPDSNIDILFEQGPCLAVNKPSGLLTQAPPHIDSLESRIKQFLKIRDHKPGRVYLGVPHRLDRPVSGAMVFAKHVRAARRLSEQFQGRLVKKVYWALLEGRIQEDEAEWFDYLRKIPNEARAELVPQGHPEGRSAILRLRVLRRFDQFSWVRITLETGRTHQIRVQAASRKHSVVGDYLYGATSPFGPVCQDDRDRSIALHAHHIKFAHPMTREPVSVTAPLPDYWPEVDSDY